MKVFINKTVYKSSDVPIAMLFDEREFEALKDPENNNRMILVCPPDTSAEDQMNLAAEAVKELKAYGVKVTQEEVDPGHCFPDTRREPGGELYVPDTYNYYDYE